MRRRRPSTVGHQQKADEAAYSPQAQDGSSLIREEKVRATRAALYHDEYLDPVKVNVTVERLYAALQGGKKAHFSPDS